MTKNTKIKYHEKLNHDIITTRRKSEAKKRRKPMKPMEVVRKVKQRVISKARHYRNTEAIQGDNLYLIIGDGTYPWMKQGIVDEDGTPVVV